MMALVQLIFMYTLTFFLLEASNPTNACLLTITDLDFEGDLHNILEQEPDMIKLKLSFNTSCNEQDIYSEDSLKYTLTHYAIVNDRGKHLLQFPLDSNFFSFGILSTRTKFMKATVSLSEECFNLTCDEMKSEVFELVINSSVSANYIPCAFYPPEYTLNKFVSIFMPHFTWNTYKTICQEDKDAITINSSPICYVLYLTGVLVCLFSPLCILLIPSSHNGNYVRGDSPFSVQRMLLCFPSKENSKNEGCVSEPKLNKGRMKFFIFITIVLLIFYYFGHQVKHYMFPDETDFINSICFGPSDYLLLIVFCYIVLTAINALLLSMSIKVLNVHMVTKMGIYIICPHIDDCGKLQVWRDILDDDAYYVSIHDVVCKLLSTQFVKDFWEFQFGDSVGNCCCCFCQSIRILLLPFNSILVLSQMIPVVHFIIFMGRKFNEVVQKRGGIKVILTCMFSFYSIIFLMCISLEITAFVFNPTMFLLQFFTYGLLIGTPFYPTYSLPIATIVISAVGYLVKFFKEFQRPYIRILDAMFDFAQSEIIEKDKFNKLCDEYHPIATNTLVLLAKIGLTAVIYFISLNSFFLGEYSNAFTSETFEPILKTVGTLAAPFFVDSYVESNSKRELSALEENVKSRMKQIKPYML